MLIVFGLPGTGKTTFAGALAQSVRAIHLNTDRVRHELGKRGQYSEKDKSTIYDILLTRSREVLQSGHDLVLDGTFYQAKLRNVFATLAEEFHVPVLWIEMTASEATIQTRVSKSRPYTEADYSVYQKIKGEFEPLPPGHLVLDSDTLDIDDMVRLALAYMHTSDLSGT